MQSSGRNMNDLLKNKNVLSKSFLYLLTFGIFLNRYFELAIIMFLAVIVFSKEQIKFSKFLLFIFTTIFVISIISIISVNYDVAKFSQQYFLLALSFSCYYFVLRSSDYEEIFSCYLDVSAFIVALGILQFVIFGLTRINIFFFITKKTPTVAPNILRTSSVVVEPSYLSTLLTPALYFYLKKLIEKKLSKKEKKRFMLLIFCIITTFSTITYFVSFIMILFLALTAKNKILKFLSSILITIFLVLIILVLGSGNISKESVFYAISMKLTESFSIFENMNPKIFETLNLSTYALATNLWISLNAPNRIFGTGLGTHQISYYNLYKSDFQSYGLNATDAFSLGVRIYSEFGIVGIICMFLFLLKNIDLKNNINVACFFYILTMLIRGGNYFLCGVVFFFCMFYLSRKNARKGKFIRYFYLITPKVQQ